MSKPPASPGKAKAKRPPAAARLQMAGSVHDIVNQLVVMDSLCAALTAQLQDQPDATRMLEQISAAGREASAAARRLLSEDRPRPAAAPPLEINAAVRAQAGTLTQVLGAAGELVLELDAPPLWTRFAPEDFQQLLLNLVLNARDALRARGRVTIATGRRTGKPAPGRALLTVTDNGIGMDAETQRHAFDPFFTTKAPAKGSGLGLPLVADLVRQLGGGIQIHSELLAGCRVEIQLPLVKAPARPAPPPASPPPFPVKARQRGAVLWIEPDAVLRKMVAGMLTVEGYQVAAATDLREARALTRAAAPSAPRLMIGALDHEAAKLALQLGKRAPGLVLINTGGGPPPALKDWPDGRILQLPKPFALSELIRLAHARTEN